MAATYSAAGWNLSRATRPPEAFDYIRAEYVYGDHVTLWYVAANGVQAMLGLKKKRVVNNVTDDQITDAAESLGRAGGSVTGGAKAEAARANGMLGGRPPRQR